MQYQRTNISVLSSKLDKYSLNDNGNIFISIYLPVSNLANSEDNRYAFEPVIYKSTSLFINKLSTVFSNSFTF